MEAALAAQKEAAREIKISAEKRFELLNELRGDVATKGEVDALEKLLNGLSETVSKMSGRGSGLNAAWGILVGAIGIIALVANFVLR